MVAILLFHDAYAPGQNLVGVIRRLPAAPGLRLRMLGAALVYDRTRANAKNFNATHWIGHASAMDHGTIFHDLKIPLSEPDEQGCVSFSAPLPEGMLPSFSSSYNTAFVTVSYGLCLHWETGEVLAVEPVTIAQNAPEESGRMNKKTRLATFVTRNLNWYYHNNSSYLAATVDMDEVDNLTSGSTLSLRLHARSVQVKSLRFTVEQRLELALPYDGQPRRVKQKAVIASSVRELSSSSPSEFKKRYFITMPTLCTTITSPIISTKYTVRIQMTSQRTAMLTLEIPVTMYSKGSFINGLPSPLANPGLTPQWANIILDSHEKNFADECAICFSEIKHDFATADLVVKPSEVEDDVASCGTAESDEFGSHPNAATPVDAAGPYLAQAYSSKSPLAEEPGMPTVVREAESPSAYMAGSAAQDNGQGSPFVTPFRGQGGAMERAATSSRGGSVAPSTADEVVPAPAPDPTRSGGKFGLDLRALGLDTEDPHPDVIAEAVMAQAQQTCTKDQLEFLYKTCRYRERAMTLGVAYASCGHAFHPLCLLEYEKHAGSRSGVDTILKCPLCRQAYSVKHFIPDENLRSLCLEHTLSEAIAAAESAVKEAEEKAKDAVNARSIAAQAARNAARLRQQAGPGFVSKGMADRLGVLMQGAPAADQRMAPVLQLARTPVAASSPPGPAMGAVAGRPGSHVGQPALARESSAVSVTAGEPRTAAPLLNAGSPAASLNVPLGQLGGPRVARGVVHNAPAAAAAAAAGGTQGSGTGGQDSGIGIDLGANVPLHEQIASMRISADPDTISRAASHPEVVLEDSEEPE